MSPKIKLLLYTALLLLIFVMAYLRLIPTKLNSIPYFDSIGHFVLYGAWGYLFARAFPKIRYSLGSIKVQQGILIIIPIAMLEESLQSLSPARTFDLVDMAWGILGISIACLVVNWRMRTINT